MTMTTMTMTVAAASAASVAAALTGSFDMCVAVRLLDSAITALPLPPTEGMLAETAAAATAATAAAAAEMAVGVNNIARF
jgi:hypothetical protein